MSSGEFGVRWMNADRERSYSVAFAPALVTRGRSTDAFRAAIAGRQVMLVTTPTVAALMGGRLERALEEVARSVHLCVLSVDEAAKTMRSVEGVCRRALEIDLERDAVIVGLGGGVCTDIVTVAASMIRRGLQHIRLPTTLIGQVDAAIGVKGAVNFHGKKSALGVFHPPTAVFVDSSALATLPRRYLSDGLAEIVKVALLRSPGLFEMVAADSAKALATHFQCDLGSSLIDLAIDAMMLELGSNLYEDRTFARRVDLGHTFSPLLEARHGFRLSHGAAVAVDIALSGAIAVELGTLEADDYGRVVETLAACALPTFSEHLTVQLCRTALADAERHRGGRLNLVVPDGLGNVVFIQDADSIGEAVVPAALQRLRTVVADTAAPLLRTSSGRW